MNKCSCAYLLKQVNGVIHVSNTCAVLRLIRGFLIFFKKAIAFFISCDIIIMLKTKQPLNKSYDEVWLCQIAPTERVASAESDSVHDKCPFRFGAGSVKGALRPCSRTRSTCVMGGKSVGFLLKIRVVPRVRY